MSNKSVYFTIHCGDGWLHKTVHHAAIKILCDRRYQVRHQTPTHRPFENSLAHAMNDFLAGGESHWLSMDDDNPPKRNPLDLVDLDLDIVGCPTPVFHSLVPGDRPWYLNALTRVDDGWKPVENCNGLVECDAIGSGCFVIARRVLEKLQHCQPFMRTWNRDGTVREGCDYSFCRKAKEAGFKVWAHFDYLCEHLNEVPLLEMIERFHQMKA